MGSHPLELMLTLHIPSWLLKGKYRLLLKKNVVETNHSRQASKKRCGLPIAQSLHFLVQLILTRKLMGHNNFF
jgi:hypothetical protein